MFVRARSTVAGSIPRRCYRMYLRIDPCESFVDSPIVQVSYMSLEDRVDDSLCGSFRVVDSRRLNDDVCIVVHPRDCYVGGVDFRELLK